MYSMKLPEGLKKVIKKLIMISIGLGKIILALFFLVPIIRYLSAGSDGLEDMWKFYLMITAYPLALGLDRWSKKKARNFNFLFRSYLAFCFLVLQWSIYYVADPVIRTFQQHDNTDERIAGFFIINFLFWLMVYLGWGRIIRDRNDRKIMALIAQISNSFVINDEQVQQLVKKSEILEHRFRTVWSGESYREYFPAVVKRRDKMLFVGAHYYDATKKYGGADGHFQRTTNRNLFWLFRLDLPDFGAKKIKKLRDLQHDPKFTPYVSTMSQLIATFEQGDFKAVEVKNQWCLLVRKFEPHPASLGVKPMPVEQLDEITALVEISFQLQPMAKAS